MISHLPQDSSTVRALAGEQAEWSATEHLLAAAVDALHVQIWMNSKRGAKRPDPIRRPGDKPTAEQRTFKAARAYSAAEIDAMFPRARIDEEGGGD